MFSTFQFLMHGMHALQDDPEAREQCRTCGKFVHKKCMDEWFQRLRNSGQVGKCVQYCAPWGTNSAAVGQPQPQSMLSAPHSTQPPPSRLRDRATQRPPPPSLSDNPLLATRRAPLPPNDNATLGGALPQGAPHISVPPASAARRTLAYSRRESHPSRTHAPSTDGKPTQAPPAPYTNADGARAPRVPDAASVPRAPDLPAAHTHCAPSVNGSQVQAPAAPNANSAPNAHPSAVSANANLAQPTILPMHIRNAHTLMINAVLLSTWLLLTPTQPLGPQHLMAVRPLQKTNVFISFLSVVWVSGERLPLA